jgi:hypothetical protein
MANRSGYFHLISSHGQQQHQAGLKKPRMEPLGRDVRIMRMKKTFAQSETLVYAAILDNHLKNMGDLKCH